MANPPWVDDLLQSSATTYRLPAVRGQSGTGDDDVAAYIRTAASQRGIDPEVAIKVAQSEGGLVPNRTGSFATGKSFWPFQLHYGGQGTPYASYGTVAGMGNTFTEKTGYQPGDPTAWKAATDYALDAAQQQGWGAWYGARNQGITGYQGINRVASQASTPAASHAGARPTAAGAPPWVTDLLSAGGTAQPGGQPVETSHVQLLPTAPGAGAQALPPALVPNAPANASPWVRDLLASGTTAGVTAASGARSSYDGPPQTDEVWPVAGQQWGQVNNPFGAGQSRAAGTTVALPSSNVGADLTARYGAGVVAPVSGTVVEVYDAPNETDRNANHGWGGMTLLRGDNGYSYRLSHAQPGSIATRPGQRVQQGQLLQQVGVSGNTTGPHLDAEKFDRPGHFVDIAGGRGESVGGRLAATERSSGGSLPPWVRDVMGAT